MINILRNYEAIRLSKCNPNVMCIDTLNIIIILIIIIIKSHKYLKLLDGAMSGIFFMFYEIKL